MHLEFAGRRRGVDPLVERYERDSESLELLEERDQVPQVSSEAIEPPNDEHIESTAACVFK